MRETPPPSHPSGGFLVTAGVNLLDSALHVASPHDEGVPVKENVLASGDYKSHSCKPQRPGPARAPGQDRPPGLWEQRRKGFCSSS